MRCLRRAFSKIIEEARIIPPPRAPPSRATDSPSGLRCRACPCVRYRTATGGKQRLQAAGSSRARGSDTPSDRARPRYRRKPRRSATENLLTFCTSRTSPDVSCTSWEAVHDGKVRSPPLLGVLGGVLQLERACLSLERRRLLAHLSLAVAIPTFRTYALSVPSDAVALMTFSSSMLATLSSNNIACR